jgi:hypothetical protein
MCFPDSTVTGQEQHEFIGSVETVKEEPNAAVGYVDYEAVARWNSGSELDLRHTVDAAARRPASLLSQQRVHLWTAPSFGRRPNTSQ